MTRIFYVLVVALAVACGGASSNTSSTSKSTPTSKPAKPAATETASNEAGKKVYNTYCLACHMEDGNGVPNMNPPLAGTDWVNGDKTRLINVVLNGLSEPIEINGETYNNIMAPHNFLSDADIAAVLTYVRSSFGNSSGAISEEEVAKVRASN